MPAPLPAPRGQMRRIQALRGGAARRYRRPPLGRVRLGQNALLVLGREAAAFGLAATSGSRGASGRGGGFAAVALRSPSLRSGSLRPTGGKTAGGTGANSLIFHFESFSPCTVIKGRKCLNYVGTEGGSRRIQGSDSEFASVKPDALHLRSHSSSGGTLAAARSC